MNVAKVEQHNISMCISNTLVTKMCLLGNSGSHRLMEEVVPVEKSTTKRFV